MIMKNMNFLKKNVKKVIAALMSAVTAVTYIPTQPVQAYNQGNNNIVNKSLERASGQKRVRILKRLDVVESFRLSGNRPEWMIMDVIPVIPF